MSAGRHPRHERINAIIKRALLSAGIPTTLEPTGIFSTDRKRPDGLTLSPWARGKCLAWDATCVCTVAISHLAHTTITAGPAAAEAEDKKVEKSRLIGQNYIFQPAGFDTMGPWGPAAITFIKEVGRRIREQTGEPRSLDFLRQRVSLEIQRGNAECVLGTAPWSRDLGDFHLPCKHLKKR